MLNETYSITLNFTFFLHFLIEKKLEILYNTLLS